ncbi:hypothetical protein ACFL25_01050 [Patescibacteria group bacterium]
MQGEITAEQSLYNIDCSWPGPQGRRRMETAWTKDNNEYRISLEYYEDEEEKYLRILDQILSTFEFLNNTSNWTDYTDNSLGIKFEYPSAWSLHEKETPIPQVILTSDFHSSMTAPTSTIPYQTVIYNIENKTGGDIMDYLKSVKQEIFLENIEIEEVTIGNHNLYKFDLSPGEYPQQYYYMPRTPNQNRYLAIEVTPNPEWPSKNGELMLENLNSIISSLKLIN